ncbi:FAD-dependent pyridine nucleotide-disulfide oxidoreductase [Penicillium alfredii]|uniref:FAD-dependent pyridine nucleotide-disulfide oxidoreductase n=1 Tax=Penicillium alfredii TaxID=1506179 RepID=A0A9W9F124_9EURO|nr:FAD-dependent pyridine nucleotide-disulfide oxidoreductase [Penicillium alfredii]KAJ5091610.1 FAD-dependent pyridine nucleotide-disulfide oxidoreductase [Penicillium alfredii]
MPKKVAIIGAGPSGLVTAKTLLHNFPGGTFAPTIFESRHEIGGLWPSYPSSSSAHKTNGPPGTLDPWMRTNLSRFTVAFSDLAWESVIPDNEIPVFPQARQVGQYLNAYAIQYIPRYVLRLGCEVIRTTRRIDSGNVRWRVDWATESAPDIGDASPNRREISSEDFDFLVVASGYFARQYNPDIPGLDQWAGKVIHSSALQNGRCKLVLCGKDDTIPGKVAVIGGSMSGVEAAAAVALHQSSSMLATGPRPLALQQKTVHHIYSRPFWTLPTYLPCVSSKDAASFLPLDLAMYDLSRRPPGPIEYAPGPIPEEKAAKTNSYFQSLLGPDYELFGHMHPRDTEDQTTTQSPPWVAIGNDYAEYVRSGAIAATMGRVISVHSEPDSDLASIEIKGPGSQTSTLDGIAAIVMATGFAPFESLSFLSAEILQSLEYSVEDPFSPLILDKGGTLRSEIPDLGFVGFYRGPYWGVMEMQARFLGDIWSKEITGISPTNSQTDGLRSLRHADMSLRRGQFPMGDYVGLMESFAKELGISRMELELSEEDSNRSGPVVPARYCYNSAASPATQHTAQTQGHRETKRTLDALRASFVDYHYTARAAAALAVFRALHGSWGYTKQPLSLGHDGQPVSGTLAFYPRYPSALAYDREYVCMENEEMQSIFRLSERGPDGASSRIEVWTVNPTNPNTAGRLIHTLHLTPLYRKKHDGDYVSGEYVMHGTSVSPTTSQDETNSCPRFGSEYTFHFLGISIISWACVTQPKNHSASIESLDEQMCPTRTIYRREVG